MNQAHFLFPVTAIRTIFKKAIMHGLLFITLMSCSSQPPAVTDISDYRIYYQDEVPPVGACPDGRVCIRWFVGLGIGTSPEQVRVQEEVVRDFNASQDRIMVVLEAVIFSHPTEVLQYEIAHDNAPDVVGPAGWSVNYYFKDEWLDLSEQIAASGFDTGMYDPALVRSYQTEAGQVSLPFAAYPGAIYYVPAMFDAAGLAHPPQSYGEKYVLYGQEVDWNWDTLTEVAKRLTIDVNGLDATQQGFDRTQIVQVGYDPQWQSPNALATYYSGAAGIYEGTTKGEYRSTIPDGWKEAWRWYYDGMYGDEPFIANGPLADSPAFGAGNVFNSGKAAMALTQVWYTCCLADFAKAGNEFQLGIQPMGADSSVHGRVDADSFRIYKGTRHPTEAFEFLAYLITTGADKLLPSYGAMPAIASETEAYFASKRIDYPFVTDASWNVFVQGLAYPDIPSAEQYQPNPRVAFDRQQTFMDLMSNTPPDQFDFDAEFKRLMDDLNVIYNK